MKTDYWLSIDLQELVSYPLYDYLYFKKTQFFMLKMQIDYLLF